MTSLLPWVSMADALERPATAALPWLRLSTNAHAAERHISTPAPTLAFGNHAETYWREAPAGRIAAPNVGQRHLLSTEDASALQTFPRDYAWSAKNRVEVFRQIANAVPPVLAAAVLSTVTG